MNLIVSEDQRLNCDANITMDCVVTPTPSTMGSILIPGYLLVKSDTESQTYRLQQTFMQIDVESDQPNADLATISLAIDATATQTDIQCSSVIQCSESLNSDKSCNKKTNSKINKTINSNAKISPLSANNKNETKSDAKNVSKNKKSGKPLPPSRLARVECEVCGKEFKKNYIKEHMKIHDNDKPYKCPTCGKTYRLVTQL